MLGGLREHKFNKCIFEFCPHTTHNGTFLEVYNRVSWLISMLNYSG